MELTKTKQQLIDKLIGLPEDHIWALNMAMAYIGNKAFWGEFAIRCQAGKPEVCDISMTKKEDAK